MTVSSLLDKVGKKVYFPLLILTVVFDLVFNKKIESRAIEYGWLYYVRYILHTMVFFNLTMFLAVRVFIPMPQLVPKKWIIWGRAGVIILFHLLLLLYMFSDRFSF